MRLQKTCDSSPEQYSVYHGKRQVGYLRLRHGRFTANYLYSGGELVYEAYPSGDGCFEDGERGHYIGEAMAAIKARMKGGER